MDLGHTIDSSGRLSSNHCPWVSSWSVVARTGGRAAGWGQVDALATRVQPVPLPWEKLLWVGQVAELASSATQRDEKQKETSVGHIKQLSK